MSYNSGINDNSNNVDEGRYEHLEAVPLFYLLNLNSIYDSNSISNVNSNVNSNANSNDG